MLNATTYVQGRRIVEKLKKRFAQLRGRRKTTYVWDRVPHYRKMWHEAARRAGLELVDLDTDVWDIRGADGTVHTRINNCYVELDDPVTLYAAGNKSVTYALLQADDLPVTAHASFSLDSIDTARRFFEANTGPFVVKPASGTGSGIGVTTHLRTFDECLKAAALASLYCATLIIERFVVGEVYRVLVLDGSALSVVRRTGLRVTGDGSKTLADLISAQHPEVWHSRHNDIDLATTLELQGLDFSAAIAAGKSVLIKTVAEHYDDNLEIRTVYNEDVTGQVCDDVIRVAERASELVRSEFCGVDMIILDSSQPLAGGNGVIGEINTTPGLHHHQGLPGSDAGHDVVDKVLSHILSKQ